MSDARIGTFDELLEGVEEPLRRAAHRLRARILELDPAAVEVVRLGDRASTFGVGPKKMSEGYVYIQPHRRWVNLGFYRGVDLPDPAGLLEGTGAKLRHVKVRSVEDADREEVGALISQAIVERRRALST